MTKRSEERTEFLRDILITACYDGVWYWAIGRKSDLMGEGSIELKEVDCDGAIWHKITLDTVAKGLAKIREPGFKINKQMRGWIMAGDAENDACDIDTECADAIVQAALFGELVYG